MDHARNRLKENNFDLLRLIFAAMVCLVHAYELSGYADLAWIPIFVSSSVAVKAFFVVSGFLIFMSFERSPSIISYAGKRIRRIYPAYFTVVMFCAIGLFAISTKSASGYFSLEWLKYVLANLLFLNFLHPTLPGVFESAKIQAVNGALWTLKIEVMFYLVVPLVVYLLRKFGRMPVLTGLYGASVVYAMILNDMAMRTGSGLYAELARQLPGQLCYFVAGAFFYYFLPLFEKRVIFFVVSALAVLFFNSLYPLPFLEPFALATIVVFLALYVCLGRFGKYGDFSYGVYIIHFPVIQVLVYAGWMKGNGVYLLGTIIAVVALGAIAMWHLVEKRFLLRNSHYISAATSDDNRGKGLAARATGTL